jgi:hypothetical protein
MQRQAGVLVEDVPAAVREAVEAEARERDINRNDVIGEILARRFRLSWEPSGYPYREAEGSTQWNVKLTHELREALRRHARERKLTQRGTIILMLQLHYGLPPSSARRRPSHPPLSPDLIREVRARSEAGESFRSLERRYGVKRETLAKAVAASRDDE